MAVENLSHLCDGLLASSSMNATNTVSETPGYRAPGMPSEASANAPVGVVSDPDDVPQADYRPGYRPL